MSMIPSTTLLIGMRAYTLTLHGWNARGNMNTAMLDSRARSTVHCLSAPYMSVPGSVVHPLGSAYSTRPKCESVAEVG